MPWNFQYSVDGSLHWRRVTNQLIRLSVRQLSSHSPTTGMRGEMVLYQPLFTKFFEECGIAGLPYASQPDKPAMQG
jgi:hypothetical protein